MNACSYLSPPDPPSSPLRQAATWRYTRPSSSSSSFYSVPCRYRLGLSVYDYAEDLANLVHRKIVQRKKGGETFSATEGSKFFSAKQWIQRMLERVTKLLIGALLFPTVFSINYSKLCTFSYLPCVLYHCAHSSVHYYKLAQFPHFVHRGLVRQIRAISLLNMANIAWTFFPAARL